MRYRILYSLVLLLCLTSCLQVKDFGEYWDRGVLDPALEGGWVNTQRGKSSLRFVWRNDKTYRMEYKTRAGEQVMEAVRTLQVTPDSHMLMIKSKDGDAGGVLGPYVVQDGFLVRFDIINAPAETFPEPGDRSANARAVRQKYKARMELEEILDIPGVAISRDRITIEVLTPEVMERLRAISSRPEFWVQSNAYTGE